MIRNPCRLFNLCLSLQRECTSCIFALFMAIYYNNVYLIPLGLVMFLPNIFLNTSFTLKLYQKKREKEKKKDEKSNQTEIILQLVVDNIFQNDSTIKWLYSL